MAPSAVAARAVARCFVRPGIETARRLPATPNPVKAKAIRSEAKWCQKVRAKRRVRMTSKARVPAETRKMDDRFLCKYRVIFFFL
ncbi:MAG: hypothetical protein JRJ73_13620 [Deltaproteobacteria bacterium]|nr:hypothetical protein [Deltaproteobacteria bacterium]